MCIVSDTSLLKKDDLRILGEGARSEAQASAYLEAYIRAIGQIALREGLSA